MAEGAALYRLMTWLSPSFPVGGYSYSHGLEYAVEAELITDCGQLTEWVETVVLFGAGSNDGRILAAAYRAAVDGDSETLFEISELAYAFRSSAELALESEAQGTAFARASESVWPSPHLRTLKTRLNEHGCALTLPIAVGVLAASEGLPLGSTVTAYLQTFAANIVSAGVRLIPLGQSDGVRACAELESAVLRCSHDVLDGSLDELGSATPMVDWASASHETQYTRLFRS